MDIDERKSGEANLDAPAGVPEARVSERMRELEDSRDHLQAVLKAAADAIITIDARGVVESFNPMAERMFGYAAEEVIGRNVNLLMPEPYASEHDGYIERYLETGEARIIGIGREVEGRRKDGSIFPIDLAVSEVPPGRRFTGIIRDMSERKRIQYELARSHEALRSLSARLLTAAESERRNIARELHDDFSQRLAMLAVEIETLKAEHPELSERLDDIDQRVADLSDDMHRLAYSLHPTILDHLGLSAALRKYLGEFSSRYGIAVALRERGVTDPLDAARSSCLYRVAQEALTNVARHSKSPRATVRLLGSTEALRLVVQDYGGGFDLEEVGRRGETLGLTSMEERVRLLGGTLSIRARPGKGTVIRVDCPRRSDRLETPSMSQEGAGTR